MNIEMSMDGNGCKFMAYIGRWYTKPTRTYPRRTSLRRAILCCYSLATFCASNGLQKLLVEVLDGKVFFFGVPQLPAKWEFYQETWEVHRKDAPWPLACDNHVGPLGVLLRSTRLRAALEADTSQMRGEWCSISLSWFVSYLKFAN